MEEKLGTQPPRAKFQLLFNVLLVAAVVLLAWQRLLDKEAVAAADRQVTAVRAEFRRYQLANDRRLARLEAAEDADADDTDTDDDNEDLPTPPLMQPLLPQVVLRRTARDTSECICPPGRNPLFLEGFFSFSIWMRKSQSQRY
jgi:hypothetical protein